MQIVIDIPEEMYNNIEPFLNGKTIKGGLNLFKVLEIIRNGTPLDKIKAEIETKYGHCDICEYFENYDYEENDISEYRPMGNIADILQIIDKYRTESEG